ncbi:MAG TPA: trypsin-like peptidase domain-containing protein [Streptosporangiaceae bacterium]|nr:trypsin-like peptidase domain-containing protein [Streptosporangiaceae bacterium]
MSGQAGRSRASTGLAAVLSTRRLGGAAAVIALAVTAGCASSGSAGTDAASSPATSTAAPPAGNAGGAAALQQAYVNVVKQTLPSVVEIQTSSGLGSGVVFNGAGDIVTNAHVVGTATHFKVLLSDSASPRPATLVGRYPPDDLAVIKVSDTARLRPAVFADSSKLSVGDIVLAIGAPLGLTSTVTEGIISATGRTVSEPSGEGSPGATLPDTIQTSASINPGNSGGALVDLAGQVTGIPTLAATDQQLGGSAPGIGFAISSNTVTLIARQLVATGHVTNSGRAALGVGVSTVAGSDGAPEGAGVISVTAGGPAAKAGIKAGSVITSVNGTPTPDVQALSAAVAGLRPGDVAKVGVTTADGHHETVRVTLGQLPSG